MNSCFIFWAAIADDFIVDVWLLYLLLYTNPRLKYIYCILFIHIHYIKHLALAFLDAFLYAKFSNFATGGC